MRVRFRWRIGRVRVGPAGVVLGGVLVLGLARPAQALVIDPFFDGSVSAAQQGIVNSALKFYDDAFSNPITVEIEFATSNSVGGGESVSSYYKAPYAGAGGYAQALYGNALTHGNGVELEGWNSLASGNQATDVIATSADFRALGAAGAVGTISGTGTYAASTFDGIVTLNPGYYDFAGGYAALSHEIDEVLGIGGAGSVLNRIAAGQTINGEAISGNFLGPMDLFRYSAPDSPSFTISASATSYFSLDSGQTEIAGFNQNGSGDYGDLLASPCYAQSWEVCGGPSVSLSSPEGLALQAIGYDTPEPASLLLLGSGLAGLGMALRRRRPTA